MKFGDTVQTDRAAIFFGQDYRNKSLYKPVKKGERFLFLYLGNVSNEAIAADAKNGTNVCSPGKRLMSLGWIPDPKHGKSEEQKKFEEFEQIVHAGSFRISTAIMELVETLPADDTLATMHPELWEHLKLLSELKADIESGDFSRDNGFDFDGTPESLAEVKAEVAPETETDHHPV
jgi:hypothetical protein